MWKKTSLLFLGVFAIVALLMGVVYFAPSEESTSMIQAEDTVTTSVQVESVKIILLPSFPIRVQIVVQGQKVPGMDVDVKQERKEREVAVTMTQSYSRRIKPQISSLKQQVFLEGGFDPGTYSLRVNNYSTTFEIR